MVAKLHLRSLQSPLVDRSFLQGDQADFTARRFYWQQRERSSLADMDGTAGLYSASIHCLAKQMETFFRPAFHDIARRFVECF